MSKKVPLYWRYLSSKPRLLFRRHVLLRLKRRFEFHAGPPPRSATRTFPDGYVLEQRDMHDDFYLLMFDGLWGRWIRTKTEAGVYFYDGSRI